MSEKSSDPRQTCGACGESRTLLRLRILLGSLPNEDVLMTATILIGQRDALLDFKGAILTALGLPEAATREEVAACIASLRSRLQSVLCETEEALRG